MCCGSGVKPLFKSAASAFAAAVADIWRREKLFTYLFFIAVTEFSASDAVFTEGISAVRVGAQHSAGAGESVDTVIETVAKAAGLFKDNVLAYLLGYCGIVLAYTAGYGPEGQMTAQSLFDTDSVR